MVETNNKKSMHSNKQSIIYGLRPVMEAIGSGTHIERILIQNNLVGPLANELKARVREAGLPFQYVPVEKLNKLTTGNHQGVVATIAAVQYGSFADIMEAMGEEPQDTLVLLLDHITDVRNMGAIARTAECTGVTALVVPDHGSAAMNEDAVKTSSGALLRVPVCREQNLKTVVNMAKQYGLQVVASTEKGAVHYRDVDFRRPTLLIMGNEETGISSDLLKLCDVRASLPMCGEVASLNVSVAAGVMLYEALEQRRR
ncbi:MAG: 23S rRNA (guanosine(2251)-2'-O)-methyltransferase RlmB [Bacteroidales bacterium]|nr:23S rRNA (guanosine(2251)-2'-O)-methyltransferase RlmB [Bacteroidales bacterium]